MQGITFEQAIEGWEKAIKTRNDEVKRAELKLRTLRGAMLLIEDIRSFYQIKQAEFEGPHSDDTNRPDATEERLVLNYVQPSPPREDTRQSGAEGKATGKKTAPTKTRSGRESRLVERHGATAGDTESRPWRLSKDGKTYRRPKGRNQTEIRRVS